MEAKVTFPFFGGVNLIFKLSHKIKWYHFLFLALLFFSNSKAELSGRCAEICNNNRPNGSTDAYKIDCEEIYASGTLLEKLVCSGDCRYCETEVCDENVNPFVFNCPAIDDGTKSRDWDWGVKRPGDKGLTTGVIIGICFGCLLLLGCIGGCIYGCIYMSRQRQTGIHLGPNAMGQYYGPPAVDVKREGKRSNDLTNSNFVDSQGVQQTPISYFSPSQRDLVTTSSVV